MGETHGKEAINLRRPGRGRLLTVNPVGVGFRGSVIRRLKPAATHGRPLRGLGEDWGWSTVIKEYEHRPLRWGWHGSDTCIAKGLRCILTEQG